MVRKWEVRPYSVGYERIGYVLTYQSFKSLSTIYKSVIMKKQFVLATACLLLLTAALLPSFGNNPPAMQGMKALVKNGHQAMTIEIHISQLDKKRTLISLQDLFGKVWLSEAVWKKEADTKLLNLEGMPDGNYILWINGNAGEHFQLLNLSAGSIQLFDSTGKKELANGTVLLTGGKQVGKTIVRINPEGTQSIQVQLANLKELPSTVTLHSVGAGPVLVQNIKGEQAYAKNFNLKGMASGSYFLTVQTKEATICQFFTLSKDGVSFGPAQHCLNKTGVLN